MKGGRREHVVDRISRSGLALAAVCAALVFGLIFGVLLDKSGEAFEYSGGEIVTGTRWDPVSGVYGAWPAIYGTLFTSFLALLIALPIGLAVALFLTELAPRWLATPIGVLIELLAGVPSIVYGMWGLFLLRPLFQKPVEPWLADNLQPIASGLGWLVHWIPFVGPPIQQWSDMLFTGSKIGIGFLLAGVVLAIMILPTIVAISRDAIHAVPTLEREAAYALGSTRWEVARSALRSARRGLFAAATLGLGRALGETMAVLLVIGNGATFAPRLFASGSTLSSKLANELPEAVEPVLVSSLFALGFILFVLTLLVNVSARLIIERPWRRST